MAKSTATIASILANPKPGQPVILPVLVEDVRTILTKKGEKMAFVRFADKTEAIEAVIFTKLYKDHGAVLNPGQCLLVKATVSGRNGETSLNIENIKAL